MITFDTGNLRFNYRVAGVVIDNGRVLLEQPEGWDLWSLPGGRGELLEPAGETLKREMREELGVEVIIDRLLWVVENFFTDNDFYTGERISCHEIGLYFLIGLPEESYVAELNEFPREEHGSKSVLKWHNLNHLNNIRLVPSFLQTALKQIPDNTEYILHTDEL